MLEMQSSEILSFAKMISPDFDGRAELQLYLSDDYVTIVNID